jgi:Undecaprenyl-phosphate glucose phosphotransferase
MKHFVDADGSASPLASSPTERASAFAAPGGARTVSEAMVGRVVAAADAIVILGTGLAVLHMSAFMGDWRFDGIVVLLGTLLGVNFLHLAGAHRFAGFGHIDSSVGRVMLGWLLTFATLLIIARLIGPLTAGDARWTTAWFSTGTILLGTTRFLLWLQVQRWEREGRLGEVVAIVGAGPVAQRLLRDLSSRHRSLRVVGVYDDQAHDLPALCMGHSIRGTVDNLVADARRLGIDTVIVALPLTDDRRLVDTLNRLCLVPVDVRLCPDAFGLRLGEVQVSHMAGRTFLNVIDRPLREGRWIVKAIEDRVLALAILTLISPLMLAVAIAIKCDSRGPVFFRQKRYGYNNQLIEVLKFRSMYSHMTDANAELLTQRNDPRITRLGAFLRRTSLDELPQFLNVLRGEMSIVGPRPHALAAKAGALLYQDAVKYYDARHRVKPGITGWAQVNGWRGETDTVEQIRKRVEYDLYYIEHWSVAFDLRIILRTILGGFSGHHAF